MNIADTQTNIKGSQIDLRTLTIECVKKKVTFLNHCQALWFASKMLSAAFELLYTLSRTFFKYLSVHKCWVKTTTFYLASSVEAHDSLQR